MQTPDPHKALQKALAGHSAHHQRHRDTAAAAAAAVAAARSQGTAR